MSTLDSLSVMRPDEANVQDQQDRFCGARNQDFTTTGRITAVSNPIINSCDWVYNGVKGLVDNPAIQHIKVCVFLIIFLFLFTGFMIGFFATPGLLGGLIRGLIIMGGVITGQLSPLALLLMYLLMYLFLIGLSSQHP